MKYLAIVLGLLIAAPVLGQRKKKDDEVMPVTPTFVEGVAYALPRTALQISVKAIKESFIPGPYAAYGEQLLGLKDIRTAPETRWIVTGVHIETFAEPDPLQIHKALGEAAYKINLSANGCIAGINLPEVKTKSPKVHTNKVIQSPELKDDFRFENFTDTPFYIPGDSTNNFQPMRISQEQKAAEAAKRILDARMNQYDIASWMMDGDTHPDGKAYEISLNELKSFEKNYLSLFVGRTTRKKDVFTFTYVPSELTKQGEVIFRVSDENGIVPADDLSGRPVMIEFETDPDMIGKYQEQAKSDNPNAGASGLYYRMPAMTTVKIINNLSTVATSRLSIAQFGVVAPLPEEIVKGGYQVQYHLGTGALQSVFRQ